MNSVPSSHAAGRAAYTRGTPSSQEPSSPSSSTSSPSADEAAASSESQEAGLQKSEEGDLTVQEQQMIEERFPEDPELSMRLYGRGRGTETVTPDTVGGNLDVTG